jgi:membrane protease YdiL (CAAX protease family)
MVDESSREQARKQPRALLVLIGAMLTLWTIWSTSVLPRLPPTTDSTHLVQSVGVRALLWLLPCAVYLSHYKQNDIIQGLGLGWPRTWSGVAAAGVLACVAALAVSVDVARKLGIDVRGVWLLLITAGTFEGFQTPFFEELVFRGVIFSELLRLSGLSGEAEPLPFADRLRRAWLANVGASLVFVGMHWPWWIFTEGVAMTLLQRSLPVFLLSLVLGVVFARGRSLWPCVWLHWINNSLSQLAEAPFPGG